MKHILLDTDIGTDVDDALALLYALKSPDITLEGITTVYGDTALRAKIAKKMTSYAAKDIPVHAGETLPTTPNTPMWATGREGNGILNQDERDMPPHEMGIGTNGVDFLIERIMNAPEPLTLCTIGPLTNIARALDKEPRITQRIAHHYHMGGAISYPQPLHSNGMIQHTDMPEYNMELDIAAAQKVIAAPMPKTLIPLDVTAKVKLYRDEFAQKTGSDKLSTSVNAMVDEWFAHRDESFRKRMPYTCMHDPLTIAAAAQPSLVKTMLRPLRVHNDGVTEIGGNNLVNIAYDVDAERVRDLYFRTVAR